MWLVFLMYALFGSIFSIGKIGLLASQPYFLTGIRMLLAGILMLAYFLYRHPQKLIFSKNEWILFLCIGFFNVFITNAFEFWGLQYMSAGKTCLIYSLSPFMAAALGYFLGTETINLKKIGALIIAFIAFCPLMLSPWFDETGAISNPMELWAEGALVISALTSVIGWTFVKKMSTEKNTPSYLINGVSFLIAGLFCLLTSLLIETWNPLPVSHWPDFLKSLIYIVCIHNLICYSIYVQSLKSYSVTFMAFAGLSGPLFAAFFGWLFFSETIDISFWLAFVGIVFGLSLFYLQEKETLQNAN